MLSRIRAGVFVERVAYAKLVEKLAASSQLLSGGFQKGRYEIMAKKKPSSTTHLLRWTKNVPASEVQDPLGLGLRGSTGHASRLLFCITSVTRRARYFSFIPWCIYNYQKHEKDHPYASGLREAIKPERLH
jgi:hypothetical protein